VGRAIKDTAFAFLWALEHLVFYFFISTGCFSLWFFQGGFLFFFFVFPFFFIFYFFSKKFKF
jgi:hypothetical protein